MCSHRVLWTSNIQFPPKFPIPYLPIFGKIDTLYGKIKFHFGEILRVYRLCPWSLNGDRPATPVSVEKNYVGAFKRVHIGLKRILCLMA